MSEDSGAAGVGEDRVEDEAVCRAQGTEAMKVEAVEADGS